MKRGTGYYRTQRRRTIKKKKRLLCRIGGQDYLQAWTRGENGRLSKGKIHCSCPMCRNKSYDNLTIRDKRSKERADEMILDITSEEVMLNERDDS